MLACARSAELARRGHRRSASTPAEELASEYRLQGEPSGGGGYGGGGAHGGAHAYAEGGGDDSSDLLLLDPKRAKRVLANRQSAARSKERKVKQTQDLEGRVQQLQAELAAAAGAVAAAEAQVAALARERGELEAHTAELGRHKTLRDTTRAALQAAAHQHEAAQAAQAAQQQQTGAFSAAV